MAAALTDIDIGVIRDLMVYDPETGIVSWRIQRRSGRGYGRLRFDVGDVVGFADKKGYRAVNVICCSGEQTKKRRVFLHRIAWALTNGEWPKNAIDHINGIKDDNRICNLREATTRQNAANKRANKGSRSGIKGALWNARSGRWYAKCRVDGKTKHLGSFATPEEAHEAYMKAAREIYGEYAFDGRR